MAATELTAVELTVLRMMAEGKTNKEIAAARRVSVNTIKHQVIACLNKIGATNRTECAMMAERLGLLNG